MKNKKEKFFKFEYGDLVRVTNSQNHLYIECVYQFDKDGNAMTDHLVLHINKDGEPTVEEDMGLDDDSFKLLQVWRLNGFRCYL